MTKVYDIFSKLLTEARWKDVAERYRAKWPEKARHYKIWDFENYDDLVNHFMENDPSGSNKYLQFYLSTLLDTKTIVNPLQITHWVKKFHEYSEKGYIQNKDINSREYKDHDRFFNVIYQAERKEEAKQREKELQRQMRAEGDHVFEDDRWKVVVPKTHRASCHYGHGTKWCTTMKNKDSYFKTYTGQGVLFYILDKTSRQTNVMYKFAMLWKWGTNRDGTFSEKPITTASGFDSHDSSVNMGHVLPFMPKDMIEAITNYYKKTVRDKNPKARVIEHPDKFLKTLSNYGYYEVFWENLENDLSEGGKLHHLIAPFGGKFTMEHTTDDSISFWVSEEMGDDVGLGEMVYQFDLPSSGTGNLVGFDIYEYVVGGPVDEGDFLSTYHDNLTLESFFISRFMNKYGYSNDDLQFIIDPTTDEGYDKSDTIIRDLRDYAYAYSVSRFMPIISKRLWNDESVPKKDNIIYWSPVNSSSKIKLKYPPQRGSVTEAFMKMVKEKPGTTLEEFYQQHFGKGSYPAEDKIWMLQLLKDSGIVRVEKGPRGVFKYYLGPNYEAWTQGRLKRYEGYHTNSYDLIDTLTKNRH